MKFSERVKQSADAKEVILQEYLRKQKSLVVAYSGGVDSSYLLSVACEVLGDQCLGVTATSSTYPEVELEAAVALAKQQGFPHQLLVSEELDVDGFSQNTADRCYYCKKELFCKLWNVAKKRGLQAVADGSNYSDLNDHRPGMKSAQEQGVLSPLKEAELTKEEIRYLSAKRKLPTWIKPASACLASRFPYGTEITAGRLKQVDAAEQFLRKAGLKLFRVRYHNAVARIEIDPLELDGFWQNKALKEETYAYFSSLGFAYTALDLLGYTSGSMNRELDAAPSFQ